MSKLKIIFSLVGVLHVAPLTEDQEVNLKSLQELRLEAEASDKMRKDILARASVVINNVVHDVNKHFKVNEPEYPERVKQTIDEISTFLRAPSTILREINFPTLDDRLVYTGILEGLRGDLYDIMEGKSKNFEVRIRSALESFESIGPSPTDPKAKNAYSYLDALIGFMEKQLEDRRIQFYPNVYHAKREEIRGFFTVTESAVAVSSIFMKMDFIVDTLLYAVGALLDHFVGVEVRRNWVNAHTRPNS